MNTPLSEVHEVVETILNSAVNQKKGLITEIDMLSKRRRVHISRLDVSLEVGFDAMSGKVYDMYPKTVSDEGTAKKNDDAQESVKL